MNNISTFYYCFLCLLACAVQGFGQTDTLLLETIEVSTPRLRFQNTGSNSQAWETKKLEATSTQSVADLLEQEGGVFIKSYGAGSLATSSIRGGSAGHMLVLWNGLPIQSPMLGQLDLSMLPLQGVEQIELQKGGGSALWGSGAVGGVLYLNNETDFDNRLLLGGQSTLGSFGMFQQAIKLNIGNQKFQSHSRFSHRQAINDFKYEITPDLPKRQQSNAALSQQNLMQDLYWKLNKRFRLSAHLWKQFSNREIPPVTTQSKSVAKQKDESLRVLLKGNYLNGLSGVEAKIAVAEERLDYFDDAILLESLSRFVNVASELGWQYYPKSGHRFFLGMSHTFTKVWSENYKEKSTENRLAGFASYQFRGMNWQLQTSLRQTFVDAKSIPLIPSLGLNYSAFSFLHFKLKVDKNYRLPTLNDRHWRPGGNPDLLPESGWSEEVSVVSEFKKGISNWRLSLTAFNRNIDNWILWAPSETQFIWKPINLESVWSRGLEPRLNWRLQQTEWFVEVDLGYDYIKSTFQFSLGMPSIDEGRQLLYTPMHQFLVNCRLGYQKFHLVYRHKRRGSSLGVNENLAAYHIGDLGVNYIYKRDKINGNAFFYIHNIWNQNYQVIERRPMPGVNYEFGINFYFNKLKNQNKQQ